MEHFFPQANAAKEENAQTEAQINCLGNYAMIGSEVGLMPKKKETVTAQGTEITVLTREADNDFLSLTDIARYKNALEPNVVVANWLRLQNTIEFLGVWERLYNPDFKPLEFDGFMREAGSNSFTLSPKRWVEATNAVGIISRAGHGGGTFAHKDCVQVRVLDFSRV